MIYRDLFKMTIYFIAIKLFVDSTSMIPERVYNSFLMGNWMVNLLLFFFSNLLIIFLLFIVNSYFIDKIFKEKKYLKEENLSLFKISIIICSYYIILTTSFSLIYSTFSVLKVDFNTISKITSIIISSLMLLFSDIIVKKIVSKK